MKDKDEGMIRGFTILSQAWYGECLKQREAIDEINVGYYGADGDSGTTGEFSIVWHMLGSQSIPRLEVFNDAWRLLAKWPDFVALLAELHDIDVTPDEMAERLIRLGFVDQTQRERRMK